MHWIVEENIVGLKGLKISQVFTKAVLFLYTLMIVLLCFAETGQSR